MENGLHACMRVYVYIFIYMKLVRNTYVVVMCKVRVGNGNSCGSLNGVDEAVFALRHGKVIEPDVAGSKYGNPISIRFGTESNVACRIHNHTAFRSNNVVDMKVVKDDVLDELHGNASAKADVDIGSASIDGLMAGYHKLPSQLDNHAALKYDPQGLVPSHGVSQSSFFWVL